ncbi:hypothetical protein ABP04_00695 [Salmonella enterica subsp. enterica serovar Virchow]|jgi:hypothetical protein|uniref:Uncharacterized protein n=4 Tax=root TaxID=1 RepID=G5DEA2_9CAUD|nr:hypothetical protein [[Curtobacterium] plantarum]YP_009153303.1 hypothetical protein ACQ60_gp257 [Salmonella phage SPN3US]EAC0255842.1 hypothetical protein [Salmonella enterica subsp. enterica serovar Chester]EBE0916263.1 hypothetical protein [Salmonella enterica]EBG5619590.1 hypothetical protein [Salmonella enterica subsp. enterica serovar Enteritidis]EBK2224117.1 hypothetical protein [Salmonella enterica subsp. enterica serovar Virchow]EBR8177246.1 hypothetical protein [Salmonella enteri
MTRMFFNFSPGTNEQIVPADMLLCAIQEVIYPGTHEFPREWTRIAESYFGTEAWFVISALGRNHSYPFHYKNGVVQTWSEYTSNQLRFILASGGLSMLPSTLPLCG